MNRLLDTKTTTEDIDYVIKFKAKDDTYLVAFYNKRARDLVFSKKKILKEKNKKVWITEDLTPKNSKLFYTARQAVKNKHAKATWTNGGRIFVKKTEEATPAKISNEKSLFEYLEIVPLLGEESDENT